MNGHKREADTATETMEEKKGKWDVGRKWERGRGVEGDEEVVSIHISGRIKLSAQEMEKQNKLPW